MMNIVPTSKRVWAGSVFTCRVLAHLRASLHQWTIVMLAEPVSGVPSLSVAERVGPRAESGRVQLERVPDIRATRPPRVRSAHVWPTDPIRGGAHYGSIPFTYTLLIAVPTAAHTAD